MLTKKSATRTTTTTSGGWPGCFNAPRSLKGRAHNKYYVHGVIYRAIKKDLSLPPGPVVGRLSVPLARFLRVFFSFWFFPNGFTGEKIVPASRQLPSRNQWRRQDYGSGGQRVGRTRAARVVRERCGMNFPNRPLCRPKHQTRIQDFNTIANRQK